MRNPRSGRARWLAPGSASVQVQMKSPPVIAKKVRRLSSNPNARPRVLDLFSGCGGLSLGFQVAGCDIVAAMEIDGLAARSHAMNFSKGQPSEVIEHHAKSRDVTKYRACRACRGLRPWLSCWSFRPHHRRPSLSGLCTAAGHEAPVLAAGVSVSAGKKIARPLTPSLALSHVVAPRRGEKWILSPTGRS